MRSVTGTVIYKNKPVEGASVMFVPKNARPATCITDAQGRFTLRTFTANDGAVEGESIVCVSKNAILPNSSRDPSGVIKAKAALPARYATPASSDLRATVTAKGPNDFNLILKD
jgi:hypothetical protein